MTFPRNVFGQSAPDDEFPSKKKKNTDSFDNFVNQRNEVEEQKAKQNVFMGESDNAFLPGGLIGSTQNFDDYIIDKSSRGQFRRTSPDSLKDKAQVHYDEFANKMVAPALGLPEGSLKVTDPTKIAPEVERFESAITPPGELTGSERVAFDSELLDGLDNMTANWLPYDDPVNIQIPGSIRGTTESIPYRYATDSQKIVAKLNSVADYINSKKWKEDKVVIGARDVDSVLMILMGVEASEKTIPEEYFDGASKLFRSSYEQKTTMEGDLFGEQEGFGLKDDILSSSQMEEKGWISKTFELAKNPKGRIALSMVPGLREINTVVQDVPKAWGFYKKHESLLDPFVEATAPVPLYQKYLREHGGKKPTMAQWRGYMMEGLVSERAIRKGARFIDPTAAVFEEDRYGPARREDRNIFEQALADSIIGTDLDTSGIGKLNYLNPATLAMKGINALGPGGVSDLTSPFELALTAFPATFTVKSVAKYPKVAKALLEPVLKSDSYMKRWAAEYGISTSFLTAQGQLESMGKGTGTQITGGLLGAGAFIVALAAGNPRALKSSVDSLQKTGTQGDRTADNFDHLIDLDNTKDIRFISQTLDPQETGTPFTLEQATARNLKSVPENTTGASPLTKTGSSAEIINEVLNNLHKGGVTKRAKGIVSRTGEAIEELGYAKKQKYTIKEINKIADSRAKSILKEESRITLELSKVRGEIREKGYVSGTSPKLARMRDTLEQELENLHESIEITRADIDRVYKQAPGLTFAEKAKVFLAHSPVGTSQIYIKNLDDYVKANMYGFGFNKMPIKERKRIESIFREYGRNIESLIIRTVPGATRENAMGMLFTDVRRVRPWAGNVLKETDGYGTNTFAFAGRESLDSTHIDLNTLSIFARPVVIIAHSTAKDLAENLDTFFHESAHVYERLLAHTMEEDSYKRLIQGVTKWWVRTNTNWTDSQIDSLVKAMDNPREMQAIKSSLIKGGLSLSEIKEMEKFVLTAKSEGFANFMAHVSRNPDKFLSSGNAFRKVFEDGERFIKGLAQTINVDGKTIESLDEFPGMEKVIKGMDEGLIPLKDQELSVIARFFGDAQSSHFDAVTGAKNKYSNHNVIGNKHTDVQFKRSSVDRTDDWKEALVDTANEIMFEGRVYNNEFKSFTNDVNTVEMINDNGFYILRNTKLTSLGERFQHAIFRQNWSTDALNAPLEAQEIATQTFVKGLVGEGIDSREIHARVLEELDIDLKLATDTREAINRARETLSAELSGQLDQTQRASAGLDQEFVTVSEFLSRNGNLSPEDLRVFGMTDDFQFQSLDERLPTGVLTKDELLKTLDDWDVKFSNDLNDLLRFTGTPTIESIQSLVRLVNRNAGTDLEHAFKYEFIDKFSKDINGNPSMMFDNSDIAKQLEFEVDTLDSAFGEQIFYHGSKGKAWEGSGKLNLMHLTGSGFYSSESHIQALLEAKMRISPEDVKRFPDTPVTDFSPTARLHAFRINVPPVQHLNLQDEFVPHSGDKFEEMFKSLANRNLDELDVAIRNTELGRMFSDMEDMDPLDLLDLLDPNGNMKLGDNLSDFFDNNGNLPRLLDHLKHTEGRNPDYSILWDSYFGDRGLINGTQSFSKTANSISALMEQVYIFDEVAKNMRRRLKQGDELDFDDVHDQYVKRLNELDDLGVVRERTSPSTVYGGYRDTIKAGNYHPAVKLLNKNMQLSYIRTMRDTHNLRAISHLGIMTPGGAMSPARIPILLVENGEQLDQLIVKGRNSIIDVDEGLRREKPGDVDIQFKRKSQYNNIPKRRRGKIFDQDAGKDPNYGKVGKLFEQDGVYVSKPTLVGENIIRNLRNVKRMTNELSNQASPSPAKSVTSTLVKTSDGKVSVTWAGETDKVPQWVADIINTPGSIDSTGKLTRLASKKISDTYKIELAKWIKEQRRVKGITKAEVRKARREAAARGMRGSTDRRALAGIQDAVKTTRTVEAVNTPKISKTEFDAILQHGLYELDNLAIRSGEATAFTRLRFQTGLEKLLGIGNSAADTRAAFKRTKGEVLDSGELDALEAVFGKEIVDEIAKSQRRGNWRLFRHLIVEVLNIPRNLLSSFDLSAPFRQGFFMIGHPKEFFGSMIPMVKAAWSEKNARIIQEEMEADPLYHYFTREGGLFQATDTLGRREEAFISGFWSKGFMKYLPVAMSARAHTTYLNKLRYDVMKNTYKSWVKSGNLKPGTDEMLSNVEMLSKFVNHATGRGSLGKSVDAYMPMLNMAFFSPRLLVSRFQLPIDVAVGLYKSRGFIGDIPGVPVKETDPGVKYATQVMTKDLIVGVMGIIGILGLMKYSGAEVGWDPRKSTTFGKGKWGPVRVDLTAGYSTIISNMSKIMFGKGIGSTGTKYNVDRIDQTGRFLKGKFSPQLNIAWDMVRGKNFYGHDMSWERKTAEREAFERITPLALQEMKEAFHFENNLPVPDEWGIGEGETWMKPETAWLSLLSLIGAGVSTYHTKEDLSESVYGRKYLNLHPYEKLIVKHAMEVSGDFAPSIWTKRGTELEHIQYKTMKNILRKYVSKEVKGTKEEKLDSLVNEWWNIQNKTSAQQQVLNKWEAEDMGWDTEKEFPAAIAPNDDPSIQSGMEQYHELRESMAEQQNTTFVDWGDLWKKFDEEIAPTLTEEQLDYLYANINLAPIPSSYYAYPEVVDRIKKIGRYHKSEMARAKISQQHMDAYPEGVTPQEMPQRYGESVAESGRLDLDARIRDIEKTSPDIKEKGRKEFPDLARMEE